MRSISIGQDDTAPTHRLIAPLTAGLVCLVMSLGVAQSGFAQGAVPSGRPVPNTTGEAQGQGVPLPPPDDQDSAADLAQQLSNPVASLISVPFQFNYDTGFGSTDADRFLLNVQPVIPFQLNENWNLISRTIVPISKTDALVRGGDSVTGIGDVVQSFFFSPIEPVGGWILGAGPVVLVPIGKDELSGNQWGAGPTAVALKQQGGFTYGGLFNHIWGFDTPSDRSKVNNTFLQPFVSYTTPDAWTFAVNTESTYNWETEDWTVPVNFLVSKLVHFGEQPVSLQVGYKHYVEAPDSGPDWGLRFGVTFLFPK